ncbi:hypothetical protein Tco_1314479 [Tanacetum coccineum]
MNPIAAQQVALDNALIHPRLPNQDFVEPPSKEEMVPFIKELGYTSKCDMLSEIYTDHMHQLWRTFDVVINRCISGKSIEEEPTNKPKQAKHPEPAKTSAPAKEDVSSKNPSRKKSTGVQIKDTPDVSVSKKMSSTTTDRSKGIDLLSEAALLKDAQLKKALKRSKRDTPIH